MITHAFASDPVTQFTFPRGRQVTYAYDLLYRRTQILVTTGGANIARWEFFGPGRVAEVDLGNGLICTSMNNARTHSAVQPSVSNPSWGDASSDRLGYDGSGRMIAKRFLAGGIDDTGGSPTYGYNDPEPVVGFTTRYDHASNKFYERELHAESRSHLYEPYSEGVPGAEGGYDSVDRLLQYQRGVLSETGGPGNVGGGSVVTPISLPGTDTDRRYDLDGLGNWRRTVYTPVAGAPTTELRRHNPLNQVMRFDSTPVTYDHGNNAGSSDPDVQRRGNGNIVDDGTRLYAYDALNRLGEVKRKSDSQAIAQYGYDAFNRRVRKNVLDGGLSETITDGNTDYVYSPGSWQCVVESPPTGDTAPLRHYLWDRYIDELIQQLEDPEDAAEAYYPLQDLLYRTTALTDDAGDIIEAYDTDAYGNTLIFDAPGTGSNWWADDASTTLNPTCRFIFTGRRYDPETQIYYYRMRYYQQQLGRFISRDPIGYADGMGLYQYVRSGPTRYVDAYGLAPAICKCKEGQQDLKDVINANVNTLVNEAKNTPGATIKQLQDAIKNRLAQAIEGNLNRLIKKGTSVDGVQCNCRDNYEWLPGIFGPVPSAPAIVLCGQCVGTDKVGHFFDTGFRMKEVLDDAHSESDAIAWSYWTEGLIMPGITQEQYNWLENNYERMFAIYADSWRSDVFDPFGSASPADMAANQAGMNFYKYLYDPTTTLDNFSFDICDYVNGGPSWDQGKNPNISGGLRGSEPPPFPGNPAR